MDKESVLLDSEDRMDKALGALDRDFSRLRTGRASTGLVDNIKVDYYGTPTPISQLASVAIPDSRTITIQPWDRGAFAGVEKAILKSDLGLTPVNDGKIIRISIPPLTEDRRKELGKLARKSGEEAKGVSPKLPTGISACPRKQKTGGSQSGCRRSSGRVVTFSARRTRASARRS